MGMQELIVDYLIVGAGASGMGFADVMVAQSTATMAMIDSHEAPGGHWNDAYSYVRLHQPSYYYGVESLQLGDLIVQQEGLSKGLLHAASAAQILQYYSQVMQQTLLPSGRLRYFPQCSFEGADVDSGKIVARFRELATGTVHRVIVRKRIVDTTYYAVSVPATHARKFSVATPVRCIIPNELIEVVTELTHKHTRYTVIGSGKTGMDACLWLLGNGIVPDKIRWIMPRDAWWIDRVSLQLTPDFFTEGILNSAVQMEALAQASSVADLFARLEACGALIRFDKTVKPTMFHGATVTQAELTALRQITDVVRLGRVLAVHANEIELAQGRVAAHADDLYIDCTAQGIASPPTIPIFSPNKITLQIVKIFAVSLSPGLIAYIELNYNNDAIKNNLCKPVIAPQFDTGWLPMMAGTMRNLTRWSQDPELMAWLRKSRLDPFARLQRSADPNNPEQQALLSRSKQAVKGALANMPRLLIELGQ